MKRILTLFFLVSYIIGTSQDYVHSAAPKFKNLDFDNGISNLSIHSFEQDDLGYIWIATARGLNRYDGISFKHYLYANDSHSLYHNLVIKLYKNFEGKLFCGTGYGVNLFDPAKNKMYRIKSNNEMYIDFIDFDGKTYGVSYLGGLTVYNPDKQSFDRIPNFPTELVIESLITDEESGIWGKTSDNRSLVNFNPRSNTFTKYIIPDFQAPYLGGDMVKLDQNILIAGKTIQFFNLSSQTFIALPQEFEQLEKLKNIDINFIKEIGDGFLWIGTKTKGLYIFNPYLSKTVNLSKSNSNLQSNHLTTAFKDRDNNIWLGTFDQGADVSFKQRNNFNFEIQLDNLTSNKFVTSIVSDNNNKYYIGTRSDGLYIYHGGMIKEGKHYNSGNSVLQDNHIRTLFIDSRKQVWIGTEKALQITNLDLQQSKELAIPQPNDGMVCFCEQDKKILAGSDKQGLFIFDYNGTIIRHELRLGNNITKIIPVGTEEVILSSYAFGVYLYNVSTGAYSKLGQLIKHENNHLNEVITMHLDTDSILWLGNYNYGLYKLNLHTNELKVFTEIDGLPNNDVVCIEEDNNGELWLGTSYGLSCFDKQEEFINFFQNEGLKNIQFHQKASLIDSFGTIFMGGNYGLTFFNPGILSESQHKTSPKLILETLKVANKEILPDDETEILSQNLNNTGAIKLNHKQKVFTIEYHAFDYIAANKVKYDYMLEGFDMEWNYVGERNFANYANLNPSTYRFKVKAQNNIGEWSEVSVLDITIKPSPFMTIWAFAIYILLLSALVFISFRLILNAKLYKSKLELEHNERVRENEVAQMKMRFFTNISHEIRTPLTLIKGNIDILSQDLASKNITFASFKGLQYSTNRLLTLINQLLSLRKLENDTLDLKVRKDDIISISNKLIQSFRYVASTRNITIKIITDFDKLIIPVDEDKFEKIISNLLSNALKHAKDNGSILVKIEMLEFNELSIFFTDTTNLSSNGFVKISVIDDGLGIPKKDLPNIFNRFAQSEIDRSKPDYSGTGIGLDFTKRLVELHHGAITVKSIEQVETTFTFVLPFDEKPYENDIWVKPENNDYKTTHEITTLEKETEEVNGNKQHKEKAVVLLVEDDLELNRFISTSLKKQFNVVSCYNGKEGIKLAQNQLPDIILSDIMMPEMNGLELCKRVREDALISHIPIVLLTAKTDMESKISGYEYGADDYVSKPFDLNILVARINSLIELRKKLQAAYKRGILDEHQVEITNQFELNFIKRIEAIVSTEYHSPKLNVNLLADKMNMSRTNFYRKFMSIMDISPKEFITKYRINKAIELIQSGEENFGTISSSCGFGSQSNFSVLFKKEKGATPLQYKKSL